MVCCVIPAYKARATVCEVVASTVLYVDLVIVVDDACPEGSGNAVAEAFPNHPSVCVIRRTKNGGVGAATKSGIKKALELSVDVIIKIDADGQMEASYIPSLVELFERDRDLVFVKGNRFFDPLVLRRMPIARLLGNSWLSLFVKFASGYWNILDPTNGYVAFNARVLPAFNWMAFADCYFFEISILCELGLKHAQIAEMQMETIYGNRGSSLSIPRTLLSFPPKLVKLFLRRLVLQYFLFDVNLGSLYILLGLLLCGFGVAFLGVEWAQSAVTNVPRTTGTVMLGVLPFLMGFQLLLNALLYDVQFGPKSARDLLMQVAKRTSRGRSSARTD